MKATKIAGRKAKKGPPSDTSDRTVLTLLKQIKATDDPTAVRQLSDQLERVIFHKQYGDA